ncbi:MAG: PorT family protein [Cyclobacteriaceae bacterium]|nr:PorT family protein [Cyclobacteriaceae bacterium]
MKTLAIVVLGIITGFPMIGNSQSFYALRQDRNFLVSLGSGTANYYGEMVNPGEFGILKPNVAAGAEYYITNRISIRSELTWFQLSGDDKKADDDRQERNLSFRSNNIELSVLGAVNLTPMGLRFYQRSKLNFHAFAGIGMLYFNPKAQYQGKWYALQPLQTENKKYSRIQAVIPFGLGARIKLDPFFNILVEAGYRITFTDYLDDASVTRYPDPSLLKSDLSRALSDRRVEIGTQPKNPQTIGKRGNPAKNDGYFITNITLQYYIPKMMFMSWHNKLYNAKRKYYYRRPKGS